MNYKIRHLQPVAKIKIIWALVLSCLSVYLFFQGTWFGVILLGFAFRLALRTGVEIDLKTKRYRIVYSTFGISFGTWNNLPEIEYVSVFKTKKKQRTRVITAEATFDFLVYKVNLFYLRNKHIEAFVSDDMENAFDIARHIATVLDLKIWDATKEDQDWYDFNTNS